MHLIEAKSILSAQNGINIYRGCTHGCIYCDSRSDCYQMGHAFTDVAVKSNAPALLEAALRRKRQPCMIATGAMSDPYQPLEEELCLTRRCLALIARYGFGLSILTKSSRILRDLALLRQINERGKCVAQMTLTTYDEALCRILEPEVSTTAERAAALRVLHEAGVPTIVWLGPLLPYLNDSVENLRGVLDYCLSAGVRGVLCFGMGMTLRAGSRDYFYEKLDAHFPGLRQRYHRRYGNAYILTSDNSPALMRLFTATCKKYGLLYQPKQIFAYLAEFPTVTRQLSLF